MLKEIWKHTQIYHGEQGRDMKGEETWADAPAVAFPFPSSALLEVFTMDYFYLIEEIIWLQPPGHLGTALPRTLAFLPSELP